MTGISEATPANDWAMVNRLRDEEADSVTILCDNPDGSPNNAVECSGFWTGFNDRRFEGATIAEALANAANAKDEAARTGYPPIEVSDANPAIGLQAAWDSIQTLPPITFTDDEATALAAALLTVTPLDAHPLNTSGVVDRGTGFGERQATPAHPATDEVREPAGDVNDIPDVELLRRAISNCRNGRGRSKGPLWDRVSRQFSLGSTYSGQLCRRFGFDPHEQVKS